MDKNLNNKGLRVFSALALTGAIAVGTTSSVYALAFNQPVDDFGSDVNIDAHYSYTGNNVVYNPSSGKLVDDVEAHDSYNQPDFVFDAEEEAHDAVATFLKGDMDGNGVLNGTDAAMILDLYSHPTVTAEELAIADMNDDGVVNGTDACIVLDIYNSKN